MTPFPMQRCTRCGQEWWDSHACPAAHAAQPVVPSPGFAVELGALARTYTQAELDAAVAGALRDWTPTAENINALPEPLRVYIHGLEANCDPSLLVQENALLRAQNAALAAKLQGPKA